MLRDLSDQRAPVCLGHPVFRFDFLFRVNAFLKCGQLLRRVRTRPLFLAALIKTLCVHQ